MAKPKTKEKKVEVVETSSTIELDTTTTGQPPASRRHRRPQGCPASSTLNHPAAAPTSPGKHLRLQAERQVKEAGKLLKWALTEQTNAENKYAIKIRVHQAKCKRLEAKKITGSAVERMSGAYDLLNPEGRVGCGQEIPFGDRSCA